MRLRLATPFTLHALYMLLVCCQISAARGELAKNFPGMDAMLQRVISKEDSEEGTEDVSGESPSVMAETVTPVAPEKKAPARKAEAAPVVEVCWCTTAAVVLETPASSQFFSGVLKLLRHMCLRKPLLDRLHIAQL
jgi:hypothetical protein